MEIYLLSDLTNDLGRIYFSCGGELVAEIEGLVVKT
jgi:hypothetical protein